MNWYHMYYILISGFTLWFFWKVFRFKKPDPQSGELIVIGKDSIDINLNDYPNKTFVDFIGNQIIIPCDICNKDSLSWKINKIYKHNYNTKYILTIYWDVSSVRKITWKAYY
jgi:hypothetical protein